MLGFSPISAAPLGAIQGGGSPPASDTINPTTPSNLVVGSITTSGFNVTWTAATDNVAVVDYEMSVDTGTPSYISVGNITSRVVSALSANTAYTIRLRAVDGAGNRSTVVTTTATTSATATDTTSPIMSGSVTITNITSSGFTASWQAATDNIGVVGYEYSADTGTAAFTQIGNVLTVNVTGKAASTAYTFRVQAYDAAGLRSNTLTSQVTTQAAQAATDTTAPSIAGVISISNVTQSGFTATYPAATDNVGVTGYELSVDTGTANYVSVGNVLSVDRTGLSPSTAYTVRVRATDAVGLKSNVLTTTVTTSAPVFVDTQNPVLPGSLTISAVNSGGFTVAWQAGTDNVSVEGYEVSADTGVPSYVAAGTALSKVMAGLLPSTAYTVRVRAIDPSGNRSNAVTASVTTSVQVIGSIVPVFSRSSEGAVLQLFAALGSTAASLAYVKNTAQEFIVYNKSASSVIVNIRGSEATTITVKGAAGKTLDLSTGLNITCPAGQFTTLRLDAATSYFKGSVTVTASVNGVVFAGVLQ